MSQLLLFVCMFFPVACLAGQGTPGAQGLAVNRVLVHAPVEAQISQGDPALLLVRGDEPTVLGSGELQRQVQ